MEVKDVTPYGANASRRRDGARGPLMLTVAPLPLPRPNMSTLDGYVAECCAEVLTN